ncbi:MAG: pectin esterase [Bacillota bacterium]
MAALNTERPAAPGDSMSRQERAFQLTVNVLDWETGAIVQDYKFIANENNVGNPFDPDPANWPSLKPGASHSPVAAPGDSANPTVDLPAGKYLVTVLAPGHKLGGNRVNLDADTALTVRLQPHPLPLSKIRVHVFEDNRPVNGEDDFPLELGLSGFRIVIDDAVGEVTVDYFGNPLGTQYERDAGGNLILDPEGNPIPAPGTGGVVWTDANGDAVIEYLPPGKYEVQAVPPDGTDWIQTTTIEGTHMIDAWIEEGNDGYSPREGFRMPLVWIGFVRPVEFVPGAGTGTITGRVRTVIEFTPPVRPLTLGGPVDRPWIALTDLGGNDEQVYTGRGNPDGAFAITSVPAGLYQMAIWDEPLDHIISFRTVQIGEGETVNMGDIGIPRWFGWISGMVFRDSDGNGIRDLDSTGNYVEEGFPNVPMGTRFKDGSVQYATVTDMDGHYSFDEVFELERFTVTELGFDRFGQTAATGTPDAGIDPPRPAVTYPGVLTLAALTWAAKTNRIDWGMHEYPLPGPGGADVTNGGISGIVYYATMRNEIDPRYAAAEDYEPGIPGVTLHLYRLNPDGSTVLINSAQTDAWQHPTGCVRPDGSEDPGCTEVPNSSNQIKEGVFDGGYAFNAYFDPYFGAPGAVEKPLEPGTYLVKVFPPTDPGNRLPDGGQKPLYKVIDKDSVNTGEGDEYTAQPAAATRSAEPLEGRETQKPLTRMAPPPYYGDTYDTKIVTLNRGQNAVADFFLYTDVPVPGRIVGFLLDDVNIETDPAFIYYGEKRGIPYTPVGIRDYKGRLITTVYSDANGVFEVLLPSTYTANVPTPSGVVPGMYRVIGNDPGDPDRPNDNYNPNYQTLELVFDVWPGKTTYADVALFPITAFVETPGAQFSRPPVCLSEGEPRISSVNRVHVTQSGSRVLLIRGSNFGGNRGSATLNGEAIPILGWTDRIIIAFVPRDFPPGLAQLIVKASTGVSGTAGITIHVFGAGYSPPVVNALPDTTIQEAIDTAPPGSLIIIRPGVYHESPILYKNVKLQGMGPGVTTIDGRFFGSYQASWEAKLASLTFDGPQEIPRGQVITVVAQDGTFSNAYTAQIDGLTVTGARGGEGGGIFVNAYCRYLEISNNVIQSNGGGFGGATTIGRPYAGDNHNDGVRIRHNRILNNGGISLAGGVGIFSGAHGYEFSYNEVCGNYSAEYGGGISHYGLSNGGSIHHNKFLFNASFDEGAGIFAGGEQPVPPATLSAGSGAVDIYNNLVQGNLANDDGGGIRLLQPGTHRINIYNNMIVNNVSMDLGGGLALDDASNVVIVNNTIAKNITTATAEDSDGLPHGAGLASEGNSAAFQASLPPDSPVFSDPVLFNNIFWDNRAGWYDQALNEGRGGIAGIGAAGDSAPVNVMDLEVFGTPSPEVLSPHYCSLSKEYGVPDPTNIIVDPSFVAVYDTEISAVAFNMEPDFKSLKIVTVVPTLQGDYHIRPDSPAIDRGGESLTVHGETYYAPATGYDDRPRGAVPDIGADEAR